VWIQYLGTPVKGSKAIDQYEINDNWGILSTPVIDVERGTLYCVAWVSPDRTVARARHLVFALDLRDGHVLHPPLGLEDASYQPGGGLPEQQFKSAARKQRAALLFTAVGDAEGDIRRTVFIPAGSIQEGPHQLRLAHRGGRRCVAGRSRLDLYRRGKWRRHMAGGSGPGRRR
jgi:hypothetical protein